MSEERITRREARSPTEAHADIRDAINAYWVTQYGVVGARIARETSVCTG